jgi:hypothetical protein
MQVFSPPEACRRQKHIFVQSAGVNSPIRMLLRPRPKHTQADANLLRALHHMNSFSRADQRKE